MTTICIVSKSMDIAVDAVINWLHYHFGRSVFRIGSESDITFSNVILNDFDNIRLYNKYGSEVALKDIRSCWVHGCNRIQKEVRLTPRPDVNAQLSNNISGDYNSVLFSLLKVRINQLKADDLPAIGAFHYDPGIKIHYLLEAYALGLQIPESYIVSSKEETKRLLNNDTQYITKSLDTNVYIDVRNIMVSGQRTQVVSGDHLDVMEEEFYASYIQERVDKKYELRIFFFNDRFFPMAIFSQQDAKTAVDFRNYNHKKPNRKVPCNIPDEIRNKLLLLIQDLQLTSGSIDMIVTKDNEYVFLEINPCGQFSFVSTSCNYNIEKEIANYLAYEKIA